VSPAETVDDESIVGPQTYSLADVLHSLTKIDPWFLAQIEDLVNTEKEVSQQGMQALDQQRLFSLKQKGFSDSHHPILLYYPKLPLHYHFHPWQVAAGPPVVRLPPRI